MYFRRAKTDGERDRIDANILGGYEQVPRFGFWRKPVFEVTEHGIQYRNHTYKWAEILEISAHRGFGMIKLSKDVKCTIHMNSFRKIGERAKVSLFGDNSAFDALRSHWIQARAHAELSQRIGPIQDEIDVLMADYDKCDELSECTEMRKGINQKVLDLRRAYDEFIEEKTREHLKRSRWRFFILFLLLIYLVISAYVKKVYS